MVGKKELKPQQLYLCTVIKNMAKHHFSSLGEIIRYSTEHKLPFALYSLPNERQIRCITQDTAHTLLDKGSLPSAPGFILYPFQYDKDSPAYFIRAENAFSFLNTDISKEDIADNYLFDLPGVNNTETGKSEHCKKVEKAVSAIRKGDFEKVVLSRVQVVDTGDKSPVKAYVELFEKYTSAFVSLVYIPGKVLWLTATPELLVSVTKDEVQTVALAGTRKAGQADWADKEKKEQQLVTDYIYKVVDKHCSRIVMEGPKEVIAGNVAHLKTSFTGQLDSGLWDLVMELHPTPAVCGVPKEKALNFIKDTEAHQRKYYAGFLGPCNMDKETNLFVNLRCAELSNGKADLYVGGGITADSVPADEWDETVMKANTLMPILKPSIEMVNGK